ncbi:MAG: hypothetical protein WC974_09885 [Thermoplasmata archaeon]|jgi:hypothetical protein
MDKILIKKSSSYKVGICGVRALLGDKERAVKFEQDEPIEVDANEFVRLTALDWCEEYKNASSDTQNIN